MERIKNWHILDSKIPITLAPFACDYIHCYCCIYKLSASLHTMISSKLSNATCVHCFQAINRAMLHGVTLTVTLYYRYLCLKGHDQPKIIARLC